MDQHQAAWNETVAERIIANLRKRNMEGSYAATAAQTKEEIVAMIPEGVRVYRGGSMSTIELGFWPALARIPGVEVIDPYRAGLSAEEGLAARRRGLTADVMIASTNAVTLDGRLVNLDGRGNRVSALMFGPEKVILAVGMNKVAPDLESAKARVKHQAAPINAARLGLKTPCAATGLCADCSSPQRICNMWGIIEGHAVKGRIHVKLVGESLGY
ncbi:lactate utilization protein [Desulfuromonas sp. TF]|uniref:lactate utilization protein n=1 Tax=Desulfuromonas sp. TF TaxID=1232410 RepID=UPI0004242CF3|nr:lactate utilization protein [Desulfuromonas sp. TF]